MHGEVVQLSISPGGVPKTPIEVANVGALGIAGDGHTDMKHHGGPERALCLWAVERIEALQEEGHPIFAGAAGENVTIRGVNWDRVVPGVRLRIGDVLCEITGYASPCDNNSEWFRGRDFTRMSQKVHPGWSRTYARIIETGVIRTGDPVELIDVAEGAAAG